MTKAYCDELGAFKPSFYNQKWQFETKNWFDRYDQYALVIQEKSPFLWSVLDSMKILAAGFLKKGIQKVFLLIVFTEPIF